MNATLFHPLALLLTAPLAAAQIPTAGLVARYLFSGNPLDTGPNLLHATVHNGPAPLRIGTRHFSSYFQGAIDDVLIYDRALTASEIQGIYAVPEPRGVASLLVTFGPVALFCVTRRRRAPA